MTTPSRPPFALVALDASHEVDGFFSGDRSGSSEIDAYLKTAALIDQRHGVASVRVAIDRDSKRPNSVVGFFTLSPLSVPISAVVLSALGMEALSYRHVGGFLLGRLGVDAAYQGRALGSALVAAAIRVAKTAQTDVGGTFLAVDPKNDRLLQWYEDLDFGFARLNPSDSMRRRLVLRL